MPKTPKMPNTASNFKLIKKVGNTTEYLLKPNGLKVLLHKIDGTGVVTTNITYFVGSRDETAGQTGLAHMLEHMLFKPTVNDLKERSSGGAMKYEREVGVVLNANTWKDRTTYFFCQPVEHLERALRIEADRMQNVVISDKEFLPERGNVLSEFDMYNGDPKFALEVAVSGTALLSHPYRHETIGFREDIEAYTTDKLNRFYKNFYCPNNAMLMLVGDIEANAVLPLIEKYFAELKSNPALQPRLKIKEPKKEGIRRIEIERPGTTNLILFSFDTGPFPQKDWFVTNIALRFLAQNSSSLLIQKFVDTGKASEIEYSVSPMCDTHQAGLYVTLAKGATHKKIEQEVLSTIEKVTEAEIRKELNAIKNKMLSEETYARDSSLDIAAELTEYASALNWAAYYETTTRINEISAKEIKQYLTEAFKLQNLTIGYYKSL